MNHLPEHVTDQNGHQHKVVGYDLLHKIYIIRDGRVGIDKIRTLMGYDPIKQHFVQVIHNLEKGTAMRAEGIEPWAPEVYDRWDSLPKYEPQKRRSRKQES